MKISGIYKIQSIIKPERIYVGSGIDIKDRWYNHISKLRKGIHHSAKLQNHYNKYGKDDLVFIIVEPCFSQFLIIREQYYIDTLKPYFNIAKIAGNCLGVKRSEETKQKIRKSNLGKHICSDEYRKKLSNSAKNKPPITEETKRKISISHKGLNTWQKGKVSPNKGNHLSLESKQKIREVNQGKKLSKEHRKKISESNKGREVSEETKKKISKAAKIRYANKRLNKIA